MSAHFDTIRDTAENITDYIHVVEDDLVSASQQRNPDPTAAG